MQSRNYLYPIFLKVHDLKVLIVGGGYVCCEKLHFLLKSSPHSDITIVAPEFRPEVHDLLEKYPESAIRFVQRKFQSSDIHGHHIVIAATCFHDVNAEVYQAAKANGILINVADTPELCDFYMGSIVNKGQVKVAISTNGQSPTLAKRLREFFEQVLPGEIDELSSNLHKYRETISSYEFEEKVKQLNNLTAQLIK